MWTTENRGRYDRSRLCYPSDLTDDEWGLVEPLIPPGKRGGDKRTVIMREVVNGLMYILSTGCQWRNPKGFAAALDLVRLLRSVELGWHARSHPSRTLCEVPRGGRQRSEPHRRSDQQPEREKRQKGGRRSILRVTTRKEIKGKKRHILVDTHGLLIHAIVHAADIQDRDGGALVMATMFGLYPFLLKLYADGGYQGPVFRRAASKIMAQVNVEIVKRSDHAKGFVVLPKRWVVERTFAWLGRCRRLAKDWENLNRKALAFLRLASIRLMLRKLCNPV